MKKSTDTVQRMIDKFLGIPTMEERGMAIMCMIAYQVGKDAGKEEKIREDNNQRKKHE